MYYEIHGRGLPLVLPHGGLSATGSSFGKYIPELAKTHQVIALEMQAHGHTADVDRPRRIPTLADDTVAALGELGVKEADFFGYSMGAGIALDIAIRHRKLVRKLVVASLTSTSRGSIPASWRAWPSCDRSTWSGLGTTHAYSCCHRLAATRLSWSRRSRT